MADSRDVVTIYLAYRPPELAPFFGKRSNPISRLIGPVS
jgi:hypothetical protein